MNKDKLYNEFEDLAVKLGMRIIKGKGDFKGGVCILKDEKIIVVNKRKPMEQKLKILAKSVQIILKQPRMRKLQIFPIFPPTPDLMLVICFFPFFGGGPIQNL